MKDVAALKQPPIAYSQDRARGLWKIRCFVSQFKHVHYHNNLFLLSVHKKLYMSCKIFLLFLKLASWAFWRSLLRGFVAYGSSCAEPPSWESTVSPSSSFLIQEPKRLKTKLPLFSKGSLAIRFSVFKERLFHTC